MYNLHLSSEQLAFRDAVRDFVAQEVKPVALKSERLEAFERALLTETLDKASQMGLRAMAIAEDLGGAGADDLTCCIVIEELAVGDVDVAAVLAETVGLSRLLFTHLMSPSQRERFLPEFVSDDHCHLALASAADTRIGVNYYSSAPQAASGLTATRADDGGFVINGRADAVANAPIARLIIVEASADGEPGWFLVPQDVEGLEVVADEARLRRHGAVGTLVLKDCRVKADCRLDGPADAAARDGVLDQALALGIGRAAYEAALDYAQLRVQGGRHIVEHQAIGVKLAEIAVNLEVARAAVWRAAFAGDHPEAIADGSLPDLPLATIAKVFTSGAVYRASKDAAEVFGAMGVMRDMPLHKYVHDAFICLHSGNGNNDDKLRIAEALAGYRRV
jgi:alkylation response protein AidB-like acyl-CoA dehydrogenase